MKNYKIYNYLFGKEYEQTRTFWFLLLANIGCLILICYAIYASFFSVLKVRSFWTDEASLAYSVIHRSFGDLTSRIFDYEQSAPVIYLYIVKIITMIFGTSEIPFRIFSFFAYLATLASTYYIGAKVLKMKLPIVPVAFTAMLSILIWYSNEFKPYMSDCAAVLFVIITYYLYSEKRLKGAWTILIFTLLIWFSNPTCFFIGAALLYEFIDGINKKDSTKIKFSVICGIFVGISFISYFFYWLKPVSESPYMIEYWKESKFPLIPTSIEDLKQLQFLVGYFISEYGKYRIEIFGASVVGLIVNFVWLRHKYLHVIYGGVLIALFASMLGKYPFEPRLFLFVYPLVPLTFFYFLNKLYSRNIIICLVVGVLSFYLLKSVNFLRKGMLEDRLYWAQIESDGAFDFMAENIKEDEHAYIYKYFQTPFLYKHEWDSTSIGNYKNNVIFGSDPFYRDAQYQPDIDMIVEHSPIYVMAWYPWQRDKVNELFRRLRLRGDLKLVYDKYETNIYYFVADHTIVEDTLKVSPLVPEDFLSPKDNVEKSKKVER